MTDDQRLIEWANAAVGGDRRAAEQLLEHVQGRVYRLALRMLGHPEDAEDATQEILVIVLTNLGSFRGESSLQTWCWRIASNHLLRVRRGRMEKVTFESVASLLAAGLSADQPALPEPETSVLEREVRLRCTQGMLLSLDRDLRIAFVLAEILGLSGEEAAAVLEIDPATHRKRLSRGRSRLLAFLRAQCGLFDPANPCRCQRHVGPAIDRGMLDRDVLLLARHPVVPDGGVPDGGLPDGGALERCAVEVDGLLRAASVLRHPDYATPSGPLARVRALLDSSSLELLRH
jgi:RNA polymerase sigma factor (sigma-70 family)